MKKSASLHCIALVHIGTEQIAFDEIKTIAAEAKLTRTEPGTIFFSINDEQALADITYHARTILKTIRLLDTKKITGEIEPEHIPDLAPYLDKTFLVTCDRRGEHPFTSYDIEQKLNSVISSQYSVNVDYKNPQTRIFLLITQRTITLGADFTSPAKEDTLYTGIDYSGIDLGRRSYRIFLGTESIKGTLAAALLHFCGYEPKHALLDPFCRHGTIPIEAALLATNTSPNKFDKEKLAFTKLPHSKLTIKDSEKDFRGTILAMDNNFKNVSHAQKNAKIAGIVKRIDFSRTDLDWLDAKIGKKNCDRIITYPPQPGRSLAEATASKIYHDLFYQAEFILKQNGKIGLLMKRGAELLAPHAAKYGFKLEKQINGKQGEEEFSFLVFGR